MTIHYHRRRVPGCAQCMLEQAVGTPAWRERDRVKAKRRMRMRRAVFGGRTPFDAARNYATGELIANHRREFDQLQASYLKALDLSGSHVRVK